MKPRTFEIINHVNTVQEAVRYMKGLDLASLWASGCGTWSATLSMTQDARILFDKACHALGANESITRYKGFQINDIEGPGCTMFFVGAGGWFANEISRTAQFEFKELPFYTRACEALSSALAYRGRGE